MEVKKSPKANLEKSKLFYREIGFIAALAIILCAFEWSSTEKAEAVFEEEAAAVVEVETIPITTEAPPPPPETPKVPQMSDYIDLVEDDVVVDTDLFISLEDDASLGVEIMDYVADVEEEIIDEAPIPYQLVEQKPKFGKGDDKEFQKWAYSQIVYPEVARENGISGRVTLQFTIDKDGSVTDVKVLRGIDPALDKEAVRVVSMSPKWTPAKQQDIAVRVTYIFPIHFKLRN